MRNSRSMMLFACLPVFLGLCDPAEAQLPLPKISVGGGLCTPMQDLQDFYGKGFQAMVGLEFSGIPMLTPFGEVSYSRFPADKDVLGSGADPFTAIGGAVGLKSTLGPGLVVKPYLLGAVGLANYETVTSAGPGGAVTADDSSALLTLGGGVAFSKVAGEVRSTRSSWRTRASPSYPSPQRCGPDRTSARRHHEDRGRCRVDGAIHRAGGPRILEECRRIGRCPTGQAVVTTAGNLPARWVIHAVGPVWHGGERGEPDLLRSAYRESLRRAAELGAASVSFPAISTGVYGYPVEEASAIALASGLEHLRAGGTPVTRIVYVLFSEQDLAVYEETLKRLTSPPAIPPPPIAA